MAKSNRAAAASAPITPAPQAPAAAKVDAPSAPVKVDAHITDPKLLGRAFAKSAISESSNLMSFAMSVKEAKAHTKYAEFVKFRDAFKEGASATGYEAADALWSRVWRDCKGLNLLGEYPKSPKPAAQKKGEQRTKAQAEFEARTKGKTPLELLAAARATEDVSKALALTQDAQRLQKESDTAAKKRASEAVANLRKRINTAVERLVKSARAIDLKALERIAQAAEKAAEGTPALEAATAKK